VSIAVYLIKKHKTSPNKPNITSTATKITTPTAYLVETSDGNTILIQSNNNNTHQFMQLPQQQQQNTLLSNRSNNYNLTIPIQQYIQQQSQYQQTNGGLCNHQTINNLPNSSSINGFERPDSAISNVYQTIDADK
jgi:hypothetical protein